MVKSTGFVDAEPASRKDMFIRAPTSSVRWAAQTCAERMTGQIVSTSRSSLPTVTRLRTSGAVPVDDRATWVAGGGGEA